MNDLSFTGDVGEGRSFRDTFEHQHSERKCVGIFRYGGVVVFDEFGGCIPSDGQ